MAVKTAGPKRKEAMLSSFARGKKRAEERNEMQRLQEIENRETVKNGGLTPWQQARAKRAEKRRALQSAGS